MASSSQYEWLAVACLAASLAASPLHGQAHSQAHSLMATGLPRPSSSDDAAEAPAAATLFAAGDATLKQQPYRPFRAYAVALRIGSGGAGGEIATPLLPHTDLRGGAQLLSYTATFTTSGISATGSLTLQNVFVAADCFPIHRGFLQGFRIAPGITLHNDNHVAAMLKVPGGQTFTLGSVDYTSEASDPISGQAHLFFGNLVAPRLTFGFGNMFPSNGGHWSFPAEIGFEYASYPSVQLDLGGSACSSAGCGSIGTPENQANVAAEIHKLDNDLAPLRFFPIVSAGVAYRFGH